MEKPTTVLTENQGKDPIDKAKEELKANDDSVVVVTSITPTKPKPSNIQCKVCVVVSVVVVLLIVLLIVLCFFVLKGCSEKLQHDEDGVKDDMVFELDAELYGDKDGHDRYPDGDEDGKERHRWGDRSRERGRHD